MHLDRTAATEGPARVTRRFLIAALPLSLGACVSAGPSGLPIASALYDPRRDPSYVAMYGAVPDERFPLPAVDITKIGAPYLRQLVDYDTPEVAGTLIVDPSDKFLYLVNGDGTAMRYGVGVGREGFGWSGRATIQRKAEWPSWHPPVEMQARDPKAREWAGGMPGGLENPLGARALYLYQGGRDTLYRIHGTSQPWTIGTNVSSGCIRMINQDVVDLYRRVPTGTEVVVLGGGGPGPLEALGGIV